MLLAQDISFRHPGKEDIFQHITLSLQSGDHLAIVGNNGTGKSTLLQILAGQLIPSQGTVNISGSRYYVPQLFDMYQQHSIAQVLQIDHKIQALQDIEQGNLSEQTLITLEDDWQILERSHDALHRRGISGYSLDQSFSTLSGGQKTKVFLAGIAIHNPDIIILDEPTNHLDRAGRELIYQFLAKTTATVIIVSHDRQLLRLTDLIGELTPHGITLYGGNYDFYHTEKIAAQDKLQQNIQNQAAQIRKAKIKQRETLERKNKQDARGKKKQIKAGMPRIALGGLQNKAENSAAKLQSTHEHKLQDMTTHLTQLRNQVHIGDTMRIARDQSQLHHGKTLWTARDINISYDGKNNLRSHNQTMTILSGDRINISGLNGIGKSTLLQCIMGTLTPTTGEIVSHIAYSVLIDQEYISLDVDQSVYEWAQLANTGGLPEHEVKRLLNRFLFVDTDWNTSCRNLSGGEKLRLLLCRLAITPETPDIIILDEPTNNLDIQNIEILTQTLASYQGTLIVVSHDQSFLEEIQIDQTITL